MYMEETMPSKACEQIVGTSVPIREVLQNIERVAVTDSTVLLLGETGTGKQLAANAIHDRSRRNDRVLVNVNCAALPPSLIESELFGHEQGAFTGALSRRIGRFEMADGGTLFLDEVGDLPLESQAKLLRVLQEGELERVGGAETIRVDVRVIAATHHDLATSVQAHRFRPDLYYRLNVFPIHIPPLRKRRDDIPLLVQHIANQYAAKTGKRIARIPKATMDALVAYAWPGNIRELQNVIERSAIMSPHSELTLDEWPPSQPVADDKARVMTLAELEREHIIKVLELTNWRVSGDKGAAKVLGMKPTTLESRMKKLGVSRSNVTSPDI
jgi:transcriptional regulator with GAF, ATPase, and Fis domain